MLGHWVYLGIQFLLDLNHVFLVFLSDEVDGQPYLSEAATAADPMQVDAAFGGEVEVDDHVDGLDVDASGDQVGTDQRLELSLPESLEDAYSLVTAHVGMKTFVLVLLLVELARQHFSAFVGPAEDDALVDDEGTVEHEDGPHLLSLVYQHVIVGKSDEHQFVHEVDDLRSGHELLLEGLDAYGEGGGVHEQCALGAEVVNDFLDVLLEVALEKSVSLVQHEELALVEEEVVFLD